MNVIWHLRFLFVFKRFLLKSTTTKWSFVNISTYICFIVYWYSVDRARLALNQFTVVDNKIVINYYQHLTFKSSWFSFNFAFLRTFLLAFLCACLLACLPSCFPAWLSSGRWSSPLGAFTSPRRRGVCCTQVTLIDDRPGKSYSQNELSEWTVEYNRGHSALDIKTTRVIHGYNKKRSQKNVFILFFL